MLAIPTLHLEETEAGRGKLCKRSPSICESLRRFEGEEWFLLEEGLSQSTGQKVFSASVSTPHLSRSLCLLPSGWWAWEGTLPLRRPGSGLCQVCPVTAVETGYFTAASEHVHVYFFIKLCMHNSHFPFGLCLGHQKNLGDDGNFHYYSCCSS